jgi:hypothetical protein
LTASRIKAFSGMHYLKKFTSQVPFLRKKGKPRKKGSKRRQRLRSVKKILGRNPRIEEEQQERELKV